jgi:integrase
MMHTPPLLRHAQPFPRRIIRYTNLQSPPRKGKTVRQPQRQHSAHAVVIGGSVAGLLAARVLADHFARVTVIERDRLLAQPDFRWPRNLSVAFKRILRAAELPETTRFHDLRHSCATLLIQQGVHLRVVMEILGHSSMALRAGAKRHSHHRRYVRPHLPRDTAGGGGEARRALPG